MRYWKFIRQDWPLIGFGFLLTALTGPGQTYFVGLFRDPIAGHFGLSIGDFGLIFSSATIISAVLFFWTGKVVDRWPVRSLLTGMTLLFAVAAAGVGLAPHVAVLAVAIFGIRHLGQSLIASLSAITMARYFDHNRAKAAGLASMGFSAAEAVFPICIVALLAVVGWRMSWLVIAAVIVVVILPVAHWLLRATHRDLSLEAQKTPDPESATDLDTSQVELHWTRVQVIGDPRFWLLLPALVCSPFLSTGLFFHQASLAAETGIGLEVIALCFTVFAVAKMAGALVAGPWVDRRGFFRPMAFCTGLFGLAVLTLSLSESMTAL